MLITKLSDLINPEVMSDMISAKVEKKIALLPYAAVNTDLEGQEGDTITIPRFEHIGDAVEVAEGEDIPMRTLTTSSVKYSIKKIGLGVTLTDEAVLSAHGNIVGETNTQLADSIVQKTDNDVVDEAYKAKTVFVADGVIGYDGIVDAVDLFNEERNSNKVMFVHPKQVTQLRKDPDFISADKYDGKVTVTGEFGKIANVSLVSSKKVKEEGGYYFNPIIKLDEDDETEDSASAITIFVKRDTNVETERKAINRTTEVTVDKLYVTALTNETKVVVAKFSTGITQLDVSPLEVTVEAEATSDALTINTDASDYSMESKNTGVATVNKGAKTITGVAAGNTDVIVSATAEGKKANSKTVKVAVTAKTE